MDNVQRFLTMLVRQLGGVDARLELGGRAPTDERQIWLRLGQDWRVVVCFDEAPPEGSDKLARLSALAGAFRGVTDEVQRERPPLPEIQATAELDHTLAAVAAVAGAERVLVVDDASPVIWGASSRSERVPDVRAARLALDPQTVEVELPPDERRMAQALAAALDPTPGERQEPVEYLERSFGGVYRLLLIFAGPPSTSTWSELAAESTIRRALPLIARLVAKLPPIEPGPGGGGANVVQLRPT